jgi:hypothetical protein
MKLLANLLAAAALFIAPFGYAGVDSSAAGAEPVLKAQEVADFSKRVEQTLASSGARVAIIARAGRPGKDLPKGVSYTHVAFAVYSMVTLSNGDQQPGYAIYNLYQNAGKPHRSSLVQDYPFDFFAAVPELRTGLIIPTAQLQNRLLDVITSDTYASLHNPAYSLLANPMNNAKQNCTEFTLNVLQSAIYGTDDIDEIKQSLRDHFEPQPMKINPLKLAAGAALLKEVSIDDHPGPIRTSTFTSIARYLDKYGLVDEIIEMDARS